MKDMVRVEGGRFQMGSDDFYPEERPVHEVAVDGFWIDHHPVTNAEFRRFVKATGYLTVAEQAPDAADYPDADPALLVPGGLVFWVAISIIYFRWAEREEREEPATYLNIVR